LMGSLLLLVGGGFAGALLILATSAVIFRTGVFPRWLAWLGIVSAIGLFVDVLYLNILPLWVWVFVASIVMLRQGKRATTAAAVSTDRIYAGTSSRSA
jgi:hypothetical protein